MGRLVVGASSCKLWRSCTSCGVGALIYIVVEVIPDAGLLRGTFQVFPRRKRIKNLEGLVLDNPSVGTYKKLGDLYLDDGQFVRVRECFDKVLAKTESVNPLYRRALAEIALSDFPEAEADLTPVVALEPKYDLQRAAGLRAYVLAKIGERDKADALFAETLQTSTLSETQYNYASFLADEGRHGEAREWLSGSDGGLIAIIHRRERR